MTLISGFANICFSKGSLKYYEFKFCFHAQFPLVFLSVHLISFFCFFACFPFYYGSLLCIDRLEISQKVSRIHECHLVWFGTR